MKNLFFGFVVVLALFLACRNDEHVVQQIDQIFNLYIDSAKQDMLNNKIPGSYFEVKMNDVYGLKDNAPVTFNPKIDADTIHYIEYIAGAKRINVDSTAAFRIYESKIALRLTKKKNDTVNSVTNDTMTIRYRWTPELFQLSQIWYNGTLQFSKAEGQPNIVKISK